MNRNEAIEQAARKLQLQKLGGYGIDANTWVELGEALAMPKADAERVALLERIDNTIQAIEFGGIPSRELMRDIRAYLQGGA